MWNDAFSGASARTAAALFIHIQAADFSTRALVRHLWRGSFSSAASAHPAIIGNTLQLELGSLRLQIVGF
ncbi:hypothetical protein [Pseudomonas amygdali]